MKITALEYRSFRNIEHAQIEPCENVNIICGDNAQGKTNLLEGIWLFTGCRSFRTSKDRELISFKQKEARLDMGYFGFGREQEMLLRIEAKRKFFLNGVGELSAAKIVGEFLAVVFSPEHLSLVKAGPQERRKFIDIAISQLKPKYASVLGYYNKALAHRNMLLKDIPYHDGLYDTLDVWEDRLAFYAGEIMTQRIGYLKLLAEHSAKIYEGISSGKERLSVAYDPSGEVTAVTKREIYDQMKEALFASRKSDIVNGSTSVGPHRDDLKIKINDLSVRSYGSQGQQRSASLALKLGEAAVITSYNREQPVALLDDVMSELDESRQNYILNHIRDWQVFITCCDKNTVSSLKAGKVFQVRNGTVVS